MTCLKNRTICENDYLKKKKMKLSLCGFFDKGRRACQYLFGLMLQENAIYFYQKMKDDNFSNYVVRIIQVFSNPSWCWSQSTQIIKTRL